MVHQAFSAGVGDVLAAALDLKLPVWSNDNGIEDADVEWHTTAELLQALGIKSV